ncbi:hypothetical protein BDW22DRAFT_345585 [Trametopsis cervina]|nr:hypothetical protein BDW22DRAFT_345585 [Trametopsis cervina]
MSLTDRILSSYSLTFTNAKPNRELLWMLLAVRARGRWWLGLRDARAGTYLRRLRSRHIQLQPFYVFWAVNSSMTRVIIIISRRTSERLQQKCVTECRYSHLPPSESPPPSGSVAK